MAMVVAEEDAAMFAAGAVVGDEFVVKAGGLDLVVGSGVALWSRSPQRL